MSSWDRKLWGLVLALEIILLWATAIVPVIALAGEKAPEQVVYVKVNVANVRSGAGTQYDVAFQVALGDRLVVLEGETLGLVSGLRAR